MNYCSIEDAWGNNFNKNYYEFDTINTIAKPIAPKQEAVKQEAIKQKAIKQKAIKQEVVKQEAIKQEVVKQKNNLNRELEIKLENKKNLLEKQLEKKTKELDELKKTQNKLSGGQSSSNITDNYIMLGLILLFIVDFFGNLSY